MTVETEYECINCGAAMTHTRAVPDVPELVRYGNYIDNRMHVKPTGEYVRYDQAAEMLAAKEQECSGYRDYVAEKSNQVAALQAELAQIKAQEPMAVVRFDRRDGNENEIPKVLSCNWLPDGNYPLYAAPVDQTAEIERLREALRFYANKDNWENGRFEHGISKDGGHNVLTAIPSDAHNDYGEVARIDLK